MYFYLFPFRNIAPNRTFLHFCLIDKNNNNKKQAYQADDKNRGDKSPNKAIGEGNPAATKNNGCVIGIFKQGKLWPF